MKILLVSHGDLAQGLCATAQKFFGASNIYHANVDLETGTTGLIEKVNNYLNEWKDEQVVVCSDLKGGSANQTVAQMLADHEFFLVSGMNLALVLQLIMCPEVSADSLKEMIKEAQNDLVFVNELLSSASSDDDE